MNDPKQVQLSATTVVRVEGDKVKILRSAMDATGLTYSLDELPQRRGWVPEPEPELEQRGTGWIKDLLRNLTDEWRKALSAQKGTNR